MRRNQIKLRHLIGCLLSVGLGVFAQSGGQFEIKQSVIAGGGGGSLSGSFAVTGTTGQPSAGVTSLGQPFRVRAGFWQNDFTPTAAQVSISGRVLSPAGVGLPRTIIVVSSVSNGTIRTSISNGFGYFRIDNIEAGQSYILNAHNKQFQFASQVIHVVDEVVDLLLTPLP